LKLEETENAIIKSTLSSLWQNFLLFLPQMVVDQEAANFSARFSAAARFQERVLMAIF